LKKKLANYEVVRNYRRYPPIEKKKGLSLKPVARAGTYLAKYIGLSQKAT
jgi:hypothetical protein